MTVKSVVHLRFAFAHGGVLVYFFQAAASGQQIPLMTWWTCGISPFVIRFDPRSETSPHHELCFSSCLGVSPGIRNVSP